MRKFSSGNVLWFGILDFLFWACNASFFGFIATYLLACGMSNSALSLMLAVYMLAAFAGAFFWGRMCDRKRTNRRVFLPVFMTATGLSAVIFMAAGRVLWVAVCLYPVLGFMSSPLGTFLDAWMLRAFHHDGTRYGRARGMGSSGYALSMLIGGFLIRAIGYQTILWMTILPAAAVFVMALRTEEGSYGEAADTQEGSLKELFRIRPYLLLVLIVFFFGLAITPINNLKIVLLKAVGGDVEVLGIDQFLGVMTQAIFIFLYGHLSRIRPYVRLVMTSCFLTLTMVLTALAHAPFMVIAGTVLANVSYGVQLPTQRQLTVRYVPFHMRSTAHSVVDAVYGYLSGILALSYSGFLMDRFGALFIAVLGIVVMLVPFALSVLGLMRAGRKKMF